MLWYTAVFLGLVQGLAEFLPISSSGHLLLFGHLFGIKEGGLLFNIILHIGTLLAVVIVYYKQIWELVKKPFCKYNLLLALATVITCGFVLLFKDAIDSMIDISILPFSFIVTGVVLLLPSIIKPKQNNKSWLHAGIQGLMQGIAVVPGFSRSGFTIVSGQLAGMQRREAADFSFLMSIPIIIASLLFEIISGGVVVNIGIGNFILAFLTAFVSGIIAIKFMLVIIKKVKLYWFSIYLFILGVFLLCAGF